MKKVLSQPPTPTQKRVRKSPASLTASPSKKESEDRDLKFMEATFKTVGYQVLEENEHQNEADNDNGDSVFQPNRRRSLGSGKFALVNFIRDQYEVPENFETNTKYGPYSGLCYEDRLITCYEWRQFQPKKSFMKQHETDNGWKICWKCNRKGSHLAREGCPDEV